MNDRFREFANYKPPMSAKEAKQKERCFVHADVEKNRPKSWRREARDEMR